jgi:hypothetical protein
MCTWISINHSYEKILKRSEDWESGGTVGFLTPGSDLSDCSVYVEYQVLTRNT